MHNAPSDNWKLLFHMKIADCVVQEPAVCEKMLKRAKLISENSEFHSWKIFSGFEFDFIELFKRHAGQLIGSKGMKSDFMILCWFIQFRFLIIFQFNSMMSSNVGNYIDFHPLNSFVHQPTSFIVNSWAAFCIMNYFNLCDLNSQTYELRTEKNRKRKCVQCYRSETWKVNKLAPQWLNRSFYAKFIHLSVRSHSKMHEQNWFNVKIMSNSISMT